jgi:hypothetical protein
MRISVSSLSPQSKFLVAFHGRTPSGGVHTPEFFSSHRDRHGKRPASCRLSVPRRCATQAGPSLSGTTTGDCSRGKQGRKPVPDRADGFGQPRRHMRRQTLHRGSVPCVLIQVADAILRAAFKPGKSPLAGPALSLGGRRRGAPIYARAVIRELQLTILKVGFRWSDRASPWVVV